MWNTERSRRITSSIAHSIAKRRCTTPVGCMVNQLLYSTLRSNSAMSKGLEQEQHSVGAYYNGYMTEAHLLQLLTSSVV